MEERKTAKREGENKFERIAKKAKTKREPCAADLKG
jgi:hypothetical protein